MEAGRESSAVNESGGPDFFWAVIAGRRLRLDLACGETQEELVD